jgi:hypothetical protein
MVERLRIPTPTGVRRDAAGEFAMELRQLITDHEREIFNECLEKARGLGGIAMRETARSRLGRAHLMFGDVYAIFETECAPPERMIAGFVVHDLSTLPQSFPRPDLSHLPPKTVVEGGELWSLSRGAAGIAKRVAPALVGLMQARAVILYPVIKPIDLTAPHAELKFAKVGEPLRNPYGETLDGSEVWVQPMILEGDALEEYVRKGFDFLLGNDGGRRLLRFHASIRRRAPQVGPSPNAPAHEANGAGLAE